MLDNLILALTHGLLAVAIWRLLQRADLDQDPPADAPGETSGPDSAPKTGARVRTVRAEPPARPKMKLPPRA